MRPRNVIVEITTENDAGDDETFGYRARLVDTDDKGFGLCEERASSGIPRGLYPLAQIVDASSHKRLG